MNILLNALERAILYILENEEKKMASPRLKEMLDALSVDDLKDLGRDNLRIPSQLELCDCVEDMKSRGLVEVNVAGPRPYRAFLDLTITYRGRNVIRAIRNRQN